IMRDLTRVRKEAWIDPLTGIHNRRFLEEKYPEMYETQRAAGRDLSLVMIDLDNFKRLNDTKGHAAGDSVLAFVGDLLRQCLRGDDCAVRYGGDEFVVILPGVCADNAKILAERLLSLFNQHAKTMFSGEASVSMTAGIAGMRQNEPRSASELLACADDALLAAKQAGKKRARLSTNRGGDRRGLGLVEGNKPRRSTSVTMNL
ncbi:MAG TPA: GGDEF domain-containing protein, partial [Phycisphaerae bacterium]|nr:GGDEF domain-containing protein [Phycisphaerae bacterium]